MWGAFRVFGPGAAYAICVNTLALDDVRERTGGIPEAVQWIDASALPRPQFLLPVFGPDMAGGYGWKMAPLRLVSLREISICSPFHPHIPDLGECGAHFCGLNAHHIPWSYYDRPADECLREHWERHRPELYLRTGTPPLPGRPSPRPRNRRGPCTVGGIQ